MKVTFLGTGAGEPTPGRWCSCPACEAARTNGGRDVRLRSAALINDDLLNDPGPDVPAACARLGRAYSGTPTGSPVVSSERGCYARGGVPVVGWRNAMYQSGNPLGREYKTLAPEQVAYSQLQPDDLVTLFAYVSHRLHAIRALIGGLTATELRRVRLTDAARDALIRGLEHPNPKVRWWCLQMMDHVGDERCIEHIVRALDDPVPRVRKMAKHALECEKCKQSPLVVEAGRRALAQHTQQNSVG